MGPLRLGRFADPTARDPWSCRRNEPRCDRASRVV